MIILCSHGCTVTINYSHIGYNVIMFLKSIPLKLSDFRLKSVEVLMNSCNIFGMKLLQGRTSAMLVSERLTLFPLVEVISFKRSQQNTDSAEESRL